MKFPVSTSIFTLFLLGLSVIIGEYGDTNAEASKGVEFLAANALKPDVVVLPSGLQYKVLKKGDGEKSPTAQSNCKAHYHGTTIDGTVFDSSVERDQPFDFSPRSVVAGWTEAVQLMVVGDKLELYVPPELAYGSRGAPPKIGENEVLIFTMELLDFSGPSVPAMKCDPTTLDNCNEKEREYVQRMKKKLPGGDGIELEIQRLYRLSSGATKSVTSEHIQLWFKTRMLILARMATQLKADSSSDSKEEL